MPSTYSLFNAPRVLTVHTSPWIASETLEYYDLKIFCDTKDMLALELFIVTPSTPNLPFGLVEDLRGGAASSARGPKVLPCVCLLNLAYQSLQPPCPSGLTVR